MGQGMLRHWKGGPGICLVRPPREGGPCHTCGWGRHHLVVPMGRGRKEWWAHCATPRGPSCEEGRGVDGKMRRSSRLAFMSPTNPQNPNNCAPPAPSSQLNYGNNKDMGAITAPCGIPSFSPFNTGSCCDLLSIYQCANASSCSTSGTPLLQKGPRIP